MKYLPIIFLLIYSFVLQAQQKDTVKVGVYLTTIYDLSLPENSFKTDFWIWFNFKNDSLKPLETMEITNAKETEFVLSSIEKKNDINWATHKCKANVKRQWAIEDFPFDVQYLEIQAEDAESDTTALIYVPDLKNSKIDKNVKIDGWDITDFSVQSNNVTYQTTYGDPELSGTSTYPGVFIKVKIERQGLGLFFKLFIGVYVAFAISVLVFFIDPIDVDPRFGLSVGSLFASVGNKYIVDSVLPETITFTLVDKVHLLTFFFIFISLMISVKSLYWYKKGKVKMSKKIDFFAFWITVMSYILINLYLVGEAIFF